MSFFDHNLVFGCIIIHIIFLFQSTITNLIAYFSKLMGICFYVTGQLLHVLNALFYNPFVTTFIILAHLDIQEAIKCVLNSLMVH